MMVATTTTTQQAQILAEIEPTDHQIKSVLRDFGVKSDEKLVIKLMKSWDIVKCSICKKKISLLDCSWSSEFNPICKKGDCSHGR